MQLHSLDKIIKQHLARSFMLMVALLLLSGCVSIKVKDQTFYGDEGTLGATYFHFLTEDTGDVSKTDWDNLRFGYICEDADTFADWKALIQKLCSDSGDCDWDTQQALDRIFSHVEEIQQMKLQLR